LENLPIDKILEARHTSGHTAAADAGSLDYRISSAMSTIETPIASSDRSASHLRSEVGFSLSNRISLTIAEAAAATGLSKRQIECAISRGELKHRVVGRTAVIPASALRKLVGDVS
jgi:excisionase family DNA binding protein